MAEAQTEERPVDMIEVNWRGKAYMLTEQDAATIRQSIVNGLRPYVDALSKSLKVNAKIHDEYLETAQLKDGFLNAVSQMIVMKVANVRFPNVALATRASAAMSKVEGVMSEKKLVQLAPALQEAEAAINAYRTDTERFLKELGASAQTTGTVLTVTTAAGFAVLGAVGAGMLVVGGASVVTAGAISGASVKVLQSAAEEVGRAATGQEVTVWESVQKIVMDGVVGAATGAIAGKIDAKLFAPAAAAAAKKVAGSLTYFSAQQAQTLLSNFLNGSGQAIVVSAATEAVETLGEMAKSGKVPTEQDLWKHFEKFLIASLTGGIMKNFEFGEEKMLGKAAQVFETKYVPDAVKKIVAAAMPSSSDLRKIALTVFKALTEDAGKSGANAIVAGAKGDESADKLAELGLAGIERDVNLKRLIDAEVKAELKKRKIAVK